MPGPTVTTFTNGSTMSPSDVQTAFDDVRTWLNGLAAADVDSGSVSERVLERPLLRGYPFGGLRGPLTEAYGAAPVELPVDRKTSVSTSGFQSEGTLLSPSAWPGRYTPTIIGRSFELTSASEVDVVACFNLAHTRTTSSTTPRPSLGEFRIGFMDRSTGVIEYGTDLEHMPRGRDYNASTDPTFRHGSEMVHLATTADLSAGVYDAVVVYDSSNVAGSGLDQLQLSRPSVIVEVYPS